ncbi:hypothetical protein MIB92_00285 [Aestuariirhabdus sp. Z084]|uniref:DUF6602 domain-containing protein n=1 Tax=Aestuariirhabdus haliotis TaxID=2918751 RepID=UPI00201B4646|nr:DUF6602 domain-containing protein [Aestuariirhabdus haliotis]MCL6414073.1 hypothetical protein [Aestuariirhabdus haliotis]MCL6418005.1 hypothetical protein [Aestuariirhabdus haliotis]
MIIYQNYAKELISKIGRLSELTKHAPSVGTFHENIVSNYLENFISKRFSVKTGFVFNSEIGGSSPQIDILIIDENIPSAYLFQDKDLVVATPDSVVCAIEIKTNFNKNSFDDICKKSAHYRRVNPKGTNIISLCFNSKVRDAETVSTWYKSVEIEDDWLMYPSEITILDSCILKATPEPLIKPSGASYIVCNDGVEVKEALLTTFLFSIMKACELKAGENSKRTIEAVFAGDFDKLFTIKHTVFKYGKGRVDMDELNRHTGENIYRRGE